MASPLMLALTFAAAVEVPYLTPPAMWGLGERVPAPFGPASARPRHPLQYYFIRATYPRAARRAREEGSVTFDVTIDTEGRVTGCTITESSGSDALDEATCEVMRRSVRYYAAIDAAGNRISGVSGGTVYWQLSEPLPPPAPPVVRAAPIARLSSYVRPSDYPPDALRNRQEGMVPVTLSIAADGRVTACRASFWLPSLEAASCPVIMERARFSPARDAQGNAVADEIRSQIGWWLETPSP